MILLFFLVLKRFFKQWLTLVDSRWMNIAIQKLSTIVLFITMEPRTVLERTYPGKLAVWNIAI